MCRRQLQTIMLIPTSAACSTSCALGQFKQSDCTATSDIGCKSMCPPVLLWVGPPLQVVLSLKVGLNLLSALLLICAAEVDLLSHTADCSSIANYQGPVTCTSASDSRIPAGSSCPQRFWKNSSGLSDVCTGMPLPLSQPSVACASGDRPTATFLEPHGP